MKRNGKIDFLRFVMSVIIVLHHTNNFTDVSVNLFPRGSLAVEFFFLLSGFFMALKCYQKRDDKSDGLGNETLCYVGRKYWTIFPNLLVASVISFLVTFIAKPTWTRHSIIKRIIGAITELFQFTMTGLNLQYNNGVTWYISAMLLAILLLYPICRKWFDMYTNVISLLIGVMIIGMLYLWSGTQTGPTTVVLGSVYKGLLRGVAEVSLGAFAFGLSLRLKQVNFTEIAINILSAIEILLYLMCIAFMHRESVEYDAVVLYLFVAAIVLTFGKSSRIDVFFDNKLDYFLGKLSLSIYVGHFCWITLINRFWGNLVYTQKLLVYLSLTAITALLIHVSSNWIKRGFDSLKRLVLIRQEKE